MKINELEVIGRIFDERKTIAVVGWSSPILSLTV
jgi:hypothetical protein